MVTLAGCIKMEMDLTLAGDRADGHMIFAVDKQFLDLMTQLEEDMGELQEAPPTDPDALMDELLGEDFDDIEGATAEEYDDDTHTGARIAFSGVDLAELGADEGDTESLQIVYDEDAGTYEVTGRMDLTQMTQFQEDPTLNAQAQEELGLPEGFMDDLLSSFDISISVTFPGEVQEHTGELSGTTVTWSPEAGEDTEIYALAAAAPADAGAGSDQAGLSDAEDAASTGTSSTSTALLVALGVLVLATAAGIGFWLVRRSRQPAVAGAPAGAEQASAGGASDGNDQPPTTPGGQQQ